MQRFSSPILRRAWIPYFILILTILLSLLSAYFFEEETNENDGLRFANSTTKMQDTINDRITTYITLLQGTAGLFAASETVTRSEFHTYINRLNLQQQFPGVQGIGYLEVIPADQKADRILRLQNEGLTNYRIWPEVGQTIYHPIIYIEPLNERNLAALGYDMYTETVRRDAMDRAIVTGKPAMSGRVTLVQEIDANKQAGFLIYVPLYRFGITPPTVEERRQNLIGFVYSPFRSDDLFRGVLRGEKSPQIDFLVQDTTGGKGTQLHDSRVFEDSENQMKVARFKTDKQMAIGGRIWTITYSANRAFDQASDVWLLPFVLIFGLVTSGVLFILSRAQYEAGRKAEISEANLHYIAEAGKILAASLDYKKTLASVARLGVPHMADWCSVDLLQEKSIHNLVIAHADERKIKLAKDYQKRHRPSLQDAGGLGKVLRTGKAEYHAVITDRMIQQAAKSKDDLAILRKIGFSSAMIVPLRVQRRIIGAMTFVSSHPKRHYTASDLSTAQEIAQRAAMAIEQARLYAASQSAVRHRDDFISVASHELKTPVTSLKMYLQVVRKQVEQKGEKEIAQLMGKMDTQVDKLTDLIGDLLNVSRIQLGRLDFQDESFDLAALITEVVESIQPTTKRHLITVHGSVKKSVYADRDRIGQVITNLLTNAIKYSPDADRIEVYLSEEKEGAKVSVQDHGIGIDEKHMAKIFDRFYRVSGSSGSTYPGLGIGLFISQEIIHRHGGKMLVESEREKGSTFSFILPYRLK